MMPALGPLKEDPVVTCKLKELMVKNQVLDFSKLAKETEISKEILIHLAEGQWHQVRREHLDSLCRYFNCSIGDLLEFEFSEGGILPA
jgi:putative transcriptional regulator